MTEATRTGKSQGEAPSGRRRFFRVILAVLVVVGLGFALRYGYWQTFGDRFVEVSENRVYQSAQMDPETLARTVEKYGIRSVLDLRSAKEEPEQTAQEREVLERLGVRYIHLPANQVPDLESVDRFLDLAAEAENLPMLIHCKHGEGRSVLFSALHRIEFDGWDNEKARRATRLLHFRGTFSPRGPKGQFLLEYESRRRDTP